MTNKKRISLLFAMFCTAVALSLFAPAKAAAGPRISVNLETTIVKGADGDVTTHVREDPLALMVVVANDEASNVHMLNQKSADQAEAFKKSEAYSKLPEKERGEALKEYAPKDVPVFTLGSADKAVSELIRFETLDADGKPVELKVRRLSTTNKKREAVEFSGRDAQFLEFGVEAVDVGKLKEGKYTLKAFIDTTKEKGMWKGMASSEPAEFTLVSPSSPLAADLKERLRKTGLFYLFDEQFPKLKEVAQKLIAMDDVGVGGWVLLGDAEDGMGRPKEAYDAFRASLDKFNAKAAKEGDDEPPHYIILRLEELENKLGLVK